MKNPVVFLDSYIMRRAADEPLPLRADLYAALAEVTTDQGHAKSLRALAAELHAVEASHQQLVLDFKRRIVG